MPDKRKPGRPRVFSDEERRKRYAAYQKKWREQNASSWKQILKRYYEKSKAKRLGVSVNLDLSNLKDS